MTESHPPHPVAEAMKWATRATTIAAEMVLPGLAGQWADQRLGTSFLTLLGFVLGLSMALWHLILLAREAEQARLAKLNLPDPSPAEDAKPSSSEPDRESD